MTEASFYGRPACSFGPPSRIVAGFPDRARPNLIALLLRCAALAFLLAAGVFAPAAARPVEVGAFVTSLSDVKPPDGSFRVSFFIWFNDPEGRFDIERDIYFIARSVAIDEIETEPTPGGGSYTYARVEAVVAQEFDLSDFPFDRQRLVLRMESEDSNDLDFVADPVGAGVSDYLELRGWKIEGASLRVEDHAYDTDFGYWRPGDSSYSQILLALDVARARSPVLVDDFLGFTFAFLLTSLTFFVPCTELGLRVGMTTGSLFAAVLNLNRLHDAVGFRPDFAMVDRIAFVVFGTLVLSIAIAIATNRMSHKGDPARANRIDTRLGIALMSTSLLAILLSLQVAMT